jgi:hypothetical protein
MSDHDAPAPETSRPRPARDAAAISAKKARIASMAGMDELFPDVHKSLEEVRLEWARAAKKMWIWVGALALTVLAGVAVQAFWMLSLVALAGAGFAWDVANERRSTYKRMQLESKIEQSIGEHEAKAAAAKAAAAAGEGLTRS